MKLRKEKRMKKEITFNEWKKRKGIGENNLNGFCLINAYQLCWNTLKEKLVKYEKDFNDEPMYIDDFLKMMDEIEKENTQKKYDFLPTFIWP